MPMPIIRGIRELLLVPSVEALRKKHLGVIAEKQRKGSRIQVFLDRAPKVAYIDRNSYVVDCDCGAGNATDPDPAWRVAVCFDCGAVHLTIVFPADQDLRDIEQLLLRRPEAHRNFWPHKGETIADLARENAAHGISGVVT